jgi:hypothetical protein
MTTETPQTPAAPEPGAAPAKKKRNLVPIIIVVVVIVVVIAGAGIYKLTKSKSTNEATGPPPARVAKNVYAAWQANDQAAAAKDATPAAVTKLFAYKPSEGTGLVFGSCTKVGSNPLPKACTFSRPGGALTLTIGRVNDKRTVINAKLGAAATTPTGTG